MKFLLQNATEINEDIALSKKRGYRWEFKLSRQVYNNQQLLHSIHVLMDICAQNGVTGLRAITSSWLVCSIH